MCQHQMASNPHGLLLLLLSLLCLWLSAAKSTLPLKADSTNLMSHWLKMGRSRRRRSIEAMRSTFLSLSSSMTYLIKCKQDEQTNKHRSRESSSTDELYGSIVWPRGRPTSLAANFDRVFGFAKSCLKQTSAVAARKEEEKEEDQANWLTNCWQPLVHT